MKYFLQLFVIYSFLGWIIDTSYRSALDGIFSPGSISLLPFTPIYGVGALLILLLQKKLHTHHIAMQFLFYGLIATAVEYTGGVLTLLFFKKRLWDYSNLPFNFQGHISLFHACLWGMLAVILLHIIHPQVKKLLRYEKH